MLHLPLPFIFWCESYHERELMYEYIQVHHCCFAFLKGAIPVQYEALINVKINTQGLLDMYFFFFFFNLA